MNRITNVLALMLFVMTISCTKETLIPSGTEPVGGKTELRFEAFKSKASANPEEVVNRVRILIFGSENSQDRGKLLCNRVEIPDLEGKIQSVVVTAGERDIYLIVNEPQDAYGATLDSYNDITTAADIEALEIVYRPDGHDTPNSPYRPVDIPMFTKHINRKIIANSKNETNSVLERTMAKVTLNLNLKNSNFAPQEPPSIQQIYIMNLPYYSCFTAKGFDGPRRRSEVQNCFITTAAEEYDFSSSNTFYVPEYILSNLDENAYIWIRGGQTGVEGNLSWYVKLGDAMGSHKSYGDRYDITRNRHYTFTGDVKSYGDGRELDVKVKVTPWNTVTAGSEVGDFVVFSKVTDGADKIITEGSALSAAGAILHVTCNTNIGGWYMVTKDADNTFLNTTPQTVSVSQITPQTLQVTIPQLELGAASQKAKSYTVSIYFQALEGQEVTLVKSLNFTQKVEDENIGFFGGNNRSDETYGERELYIAPDDAPMPLRYKKKR